MEKRTKTFQTSPYQAAKIKRLIWEFIINLWAYVVVKKTKFSEFLDRGGEITAATAFHQKQWSTQRQNIVQLLMTPTYPCTELVFFS